jgi:hypothetical protein
MHLRGGNLCGRDLGAAYLSLGLGLLLFPTFFLLTGIVLFLQRMDLAPANPRTIISEMPRTNTELTRPLTIEFGRILFR